jgi:hypothetical protein
MEVAMRRYRSTTVFATAMASLLFLGMSASADDKSNGRHEEEAPACTLKLTRALYGFQCHGSAFTGAILEPVTLVGTVEGDGRGLFEGYGTFNSSSGSLPSHLKGTGTLSDRCFGHVDYTTNEIQLPNGVVVQLAPLSFDYTVVDGGKEILGSAVGAPGASGDMVPRVTCRLVRIR